mgnify:CR=1 FL=1
MEDSPKGPNHKKTDGLAGGKGVLVTQDRAEAASAVAAYLSGDAFGDAVVGQVLDMHVAAAEGPTDDLPARTGSCRIEVNGVCDAGIGFQANCIAARWRVDDHFAEQSAVAALDQPSRSPWIVNAHLEHFGRPELVLGDRGQDMVQLHVTEATTTAQVT